MRVDRAIAREVLEGLALGGRPAAGFAKRLMLPVSKDTLLRVVRRRSRPPADPLRVIGIDDWAWRRNHRYASKLSETGRGANSFRKSSDDRRICHPRYDRQSAEAVGGRAVQSRAPPPPCCGHFVAGCARPRSWPPPTGGFRVYELVPDHKTMITGKSGTTYV